MIFIDIIIIDFFYNVLDCTCLIVARNVNMNATNDRWSQPNWVSRLRVFVFDYDLFLVNWSRNGSMIFTMADKSELRVCINFWINPEKISCWQKLYWLQRLYCMTGILQIRLSVSQWYCAFKAPIQPAWWEKIDEIFHQLSHMIIV